MNNQPDADNPAIIAHNGKLCYQFPNGRIMPCVRGGADDGDDKKFTQADMDRVVADRLARVKTEPPADYAELKAAKTELDKMKADAEAAAAKNLSEADATAKRIAALEDSVKKSNEAVEAANKTALASALKAELIAAASTLKAADPDEVATLLIARNAVTLGDDGRPTDAAGDVKKLIEKSPHLVGSPTRPKPDAGQGKKGDAKEFGSAGLAEAAKRFPKPAEATK